MKFTISLIGAVFAIGASAQSSSALSTLTVSPGCPTTTAADVMVTRSPVVVPSCGAGNSTNGTGVTLVSMSGAGGNMSMATGTPSMSGKPAMFTGAAGRMEGAGLALVGGVVAAMLL